MIRFSRYVAGAGVVLLTFAGLTAAASSSRVSNPSPHPIVSPGATPAASPSPTPSAIPNAALYARHARRLVQSYLRMKLWEMREADLERAKAAIERGLGPDTFLSSSRAPSPLPSGAATFLP